MKKITLTLLFLILGTIFFAQEHFCAKAKKASAQHQINHQFKTSALSALVSHELKYDVKFVHLNLFLERTNKNVSGSVKTVAQVTTAVLDTFMALLHQNHTIIRLDLMAH
ncbi:MAG: hypothetical protein JSU07_06805 [Bacteroidetes bacterium]|nr:hypothetical protein [Bacteroidota bacterium]